MKKIIYSVILIMMITGCGSKALISEENAKTIALEHAEIIKDDVKFIKATKDRDDGRTIYEVEFYTKDLKEFEYEIDAETGDILSFDFDAKRPLN